MAFLLAPVSALLALPELPAVPELLAVPVVEGAGTPLTEYTGPEQLRAWLLAEGYSF